MGRSPQESAEGPAQVFISCPTGHLGCEVLPLPVPAHTHMDPVQICSAPVKLPVLSLAVHCRILLPFIAARRSPERSLATAFHQLCQPVYMARARCRELCQRHESPMRTSPRHVIPRAQPPRQAHDLVPRAGWTPGGVPQACQGAHASACAESRARV